MLWSTALREVAFEGEALNIQCYDGDTIRIINANYGRRDTITCPDNLANDVECVDENTRQFVESRSVTRYIPLSSR